MDNIRLLYIDLFVAQEGLQQVLKKQDYTGINAQKSLHV